MDFFYFAVKGLYRFAPFSFIIVVLIGSGLNPFKKNPQTAKDYVNRAEQHLIADDFQLALGDYNQALKLDPNLAEAYASRGEFYLSRSRYLDSFDKNDKAAREIALSSDRHKVDKPFNLDPSTRDERSFIDGLSTLSRFSPPKKLHLDLSHSEALKQAGLADYRRAQALYYKQGQINAARQIPRRIANVQQGKNDFMNFSKH